MSRYKILLESTEPEPLDKIFITSPLNVTTTVRFLLSIDNKGGEKFTAEFTYNSASEFTVIPKTGILEPVIRYCLLKLGTAARTSTCRSPLWSTARRRRVD